MNTTRALRVIWGLLTRAQRRRFAVLQVVAVFMAMSTVMGLGAVMTFLAVLTDPAVIEAHAALSWLQRMTGTRTGLRAGAGRRVHPAPDPQRCAEPVRHESHGTLRAHGGGPDSRSPVLRLSAARVPVSRPRGFGAAHGRRALPGRPRDQHLVERAAADHEWRADLAGGRVDRAREPDDSHAGCDHRCRQLPAFLSDHAAASRPQRAPAAATGRRADRGGRTGPARHQVPARSRGHRICSTSAFSR